MNDRQIRMLRWVSTMLEHLAKPEFRSLLTGPELEGLLTRGKLVLDAELALEDTGAVEQVGVAKDLEELERLYRLEDGK